MYLNTTLEHKSELVSGGSKKSSVNCGVDSIEHKTMLTGCESFYSSILICCFSSLAARLKDANAVTINILMT